MLNDTNTASGAKIMSTKLLVAAISRLKVLCHSKTKSEHTRGVAVALFSWSLIADCGAETRFTKRLRETFVELHQDGQLVWRHDQFSQRTDGCVHLPVRRSTSVG